MASKERLNWIRIWLKLTKHYVLELTITEEKNKKEDKISQQEVVLKKQTVELEKSSCCLIPETQRK
jgi:hypothetical protein